MFGEPVDRDRLAVAERAVERTANRQLGRDEVVLRRTARGDEDENEKPHASIIARFCAISRGVKT